MVVGLVVMELVVGPRAAPAGPGAVGGKHKCTLIADK